MQGLNFLTGRSFPLKMNMEILTRHMAGTGSFGQNKRQGGTAICSGRNHTEERDWLY